MRSARKLWAGYLGAALVVLAGMGVISGVALHLEGRAERTRQREERLDRVRIALWRLDSHMTPVLGRLAGHAYSHFVPAYTPSGLYDVEGNRQQARLLVQPSPILLNDWPRWVELHFQAPLSGRITSPQVPQRWNRWVTRVEGVRARRAEPGQVERLARLLSPARRRELVQEALRAREAGPTVALALAPSSSGEGGEGRWRSRRAVGRRWSRRPALEAQPKQQQRVPEQQIRQLNKDNSQQQFTPRSNPETIDNVLLNTNSIKPQAVSNDASVSKVVVNLSPVRSAWLEPGGKQPRLLLYRVARVKGRVFLQGALVDWSRLKRRLTALLQDLFPRVTLRPVSVRAGPTSEHAMTTLPVALTLPAPPTAAWHRWSPVRGALLVAWLLTLLALLATALVIRRMVELGDRRMSFVSAVSHELRTPLTAFRVHLDLLADGLVTDPDKRQDMLHKLRGQSERLTELVRNVLDFARLERRTFVAEREWVEAAALFDELAAAAAERVELTGLSLVLEGDLPDGVRVHTDVSAVRQIVSILVDNACKYGEDGDDPRVHLRARLDRNDLVIEVADHGPGVPLASRRHLFDAFYRAGSEMTREKPGVGLGLALAKRFADNVGARLSLVGQTRSDDTVEAVFALRLSAR